MAAGPELHFAKSGDVHIAYQALGGGDIDVLAFSSALIPIDSIEDEPRLARFHRRLASFGRLLRFDLRGIGMSDPTSPTDPPTLEQWVADAVAVLDAAGSTRAAVFGPGDSAVSAILLAAGFPERVASLVVVNGTARFARADDYAFGVPTRVLDEFLEGNMTAEPTATGSDFLRASAPSLADDVAFSEWWVDAGRRGASPGRARSLQAVRLFADVRAILGSLQVPTLVVHRRSDRVVRVEHGRYLAAHIPGARYVELEGADDLYWAGDADAVLDEIDEFVTGTRHSAGADRMLATIVLTDIVASTERAAALGDHTWRDVLDRHDALLRRQLTRFGGREVNTTGDGMVAAFDGPTRAVQCSRALLDAGAQLGIELRIGVHTGEVEQRGRDLAGLAVHIAARVQALAQPGQSSCRERSSTWSSVRGSRSPTPASTTSKACPAPGACTRSIGSRDGVSPRALPPTARASRSSCGGSAPPGRPRRTSSC